MSPRQPPSTWRRSQSGAASLVVVMVLFFVISLVAAYTNRNLIFEQRTSANQYRSTQALEVAEAGLEWAISQLNQGLIGDNCIRSTNLADPSFRQRYLVTDPVSGRITARANPTPSAGDLTAACVWNPSTSTWDCACPSNGAPSLTAPTSTAQAPAFIVRFRQVAGTSAAPTVPANPGVVWVQVIGCTRLDLGVANACLSFDSQGALNEGRAFITSMVAVGGNAVGLPQAALTARGDVAVGGGGTLAAYNTSEAAAGITVHVSGAATLGPALSVVTVAGSPSAASVIANDARLNPASAGVFGTADRVFASIFNLHPEHFRGQQALIEFNCGVAGCTATQVRDALNLNPGRPLWLNGDLNVDSSGDIGSPTAPALIVVNGNVAFPTSGVTIHGLVYLRRPPGSGTWGTSGNGRILGAVVTDGGVAGSGNTTIAYDAAMLQRLRYTVGSFVRVPGSWRDFP